jgi:hypothetical protein
MLNENGARTEVCHLNVTACKAKAVRLQKAGANRHDHKVKQIVPNKHGALRSIRRSTHCGEQTQLCEARDTYPIGSFRQSVTDLHILQQTLALFDNGTRRTCNTEPDTESHNPGEHIVAPNVEQRFSERTTHQRRVNGMQ